LFALLTRPRIYQLERTAHQAEAAAGDLESRPLIHGEESEEVFTRALGVELEKISSFFVAKEGELNDDVVQLLQEIAEYEEDGPDSSMHRMMHPYRRRDSGASQGSVEDDIEDSDDDDETTGLTRSRASLGRRKTAPAPHAPRSAIRASATDMTASTELTRSLRRHSTTMTDFAEQSYLYSSGIMLKKRLISLYVQLCELKSYVQLNKTGFSKVLKKFDKILDKELRSKHMKEVVDPAYPFKPETMKSVDESINKIEGAYAEVVTNGDRELARKDLRSHLREHVVWERNTVWRDMIGLERRAEAASLGRSLLGTDGGIAGRLLQGDEDKGPETKEFKTPLGRFQCPIWLANPSFFTLVVVTGLFFFILFTPIMSKPEEQNCLAMIVYVSLLWATEVRNSYPPIAFCEPLTCP
jgi:phosphate transporter